MKNFFTILFFVFLSYYALYSQVPEAFSYQAVVRNTSGEVVSNQNVTFQISIIQNSESGTAVYVETHSATTNDFGLANLNIGTGTPVSGNFSPEGWGTAPHFLKVEIDPEGGTTFIEMGTTQLLAVPYAFHAQTVANDSDDQTLSITGNDLSISDGNTVALPGNSPWLSDGNDIYYNSGKVGIGDAPVGSRQFSVTTGDNIAIYARSNTDYGTIFAANSGTGPVADFRGEIKIMDGNEGSGKVLTSDSDGLASWQDPASSLWNQNGDEIYFNNHVGIGTDNPAFELDIVDNSMATFARIKSGANNAGLIIERVGTTDASNIIYKTGGANTFYAGLLGSSSYKISTQNPSLNGLEVELDGDVVLSDELHSATEGSSNMMPFAYGYITSSGTNSSSTSNVGTVSKPLTGQYKVEIDGLGTDYIVLVTPNDGSAYLTGVVIGRASANFTVAIWDTRDDTYKDGGFSFIVYKP